MSKHTPGPWNVGASNQIWHKSPTLRNRRICQVLSRHIGNPVTGKEEDANADLIAEAPAMFEALKALIDGPGSSMSTNIQKCREVYERITQKETP